MGAIDLFWHLGNLLALSLLFGGIAAGGAKLFWRRRLASTSWLRLTLAVAVAAGGVTLGGLLLFGRDGRMATYGLMVLAGAVALAWAGFRSRA